MLFIFKIINHLYDFITILFTIKHMVIYYNTNAIK